MRRMKWVFIFCCISHLKCLIDVRPDLVRIMIRPLQWRHNDHDSVSNHQLRGCLLNRLFRRRSKKTSKLRVTGLCAGNSPGPVNSPHRGPVTRKMFPFDDVIMRRIGKKPLPETTWTQYHRRANRTKKRSLLLSLCLLTLYVLNVSEGT